MALATLSIDLFISRLAKFEGDMGKAAKATEQASQRITSSLGVVKAGIAGLAASVTFGTLINMSKAAIDSIDALNDLKDATGSSIENISALEDVAARTGTSFDTVGASLTKFNQALNNSDPDSKVANALDAIGLSAKDLKALDPAEALRQTAVALAGFADDGNKARLTQELFGKSLKEVAPFLKDLAEQGKLVATVTTAQAQAAEDFNKQLFQLQKNASDTGRALVSDLLPSLNAVLSNFSKIKSEGLFGTLLIDAAKDVVGLGKLSSDAGADINRLIASRDALYKKFGQTGQSSKAIKDDIAEVNKLIAISRIRQATAVNSTAEDYGDAISRKFNTAKKSVGDIGGKPDKPKKQIDQDADFKRYLDNLKQQIEKTQELTKVEQLLVDIKEKRLTVSDAQKQVLSMFASKADAAKAEAEAQKLLDEARKSNSKYIDDLMRQQAAMQDNNQKLREQVEEIGLSKEAVNQLTLARMDSNIALEEQNQLTRLQLGIGVEELNLYERRLDLMKQTRELTATGQIRQAASDTKSDQDKASKEYADTLRGDLKGAFSAAFHDSKDPLKAFGDALENVVYTRAATALGEALAEAAMQQVGSKAITSVGGGIGDFASLLFNGFSFDGGGSTGSGPRSGGLDGKGGFMAMLHPQETVLDHTKGQMGVGSGSVTVSIVNHIDSRSDIATILAITKQSEQRVKSEILNSRQRGGAFA